MDKIIISIIQGIIIENSLNKMGTNESKQLLGSIYNWKELISKRTEIEGHPSLVQDELSLQVADCYEIPMHNHLDYHLKLMIRRKNIDDPSIIKVIDAQLKEKTILDCGTMDVVQVFTEFVPHRLDDIQLGDIEAMLVLQQVLRGCQILSQFAGNYFAIHPKMIGLMENGRIKVWLNQNFGKLQIDQRELLRNQQEMMRAIMNIFGPKFTRKYDFLQSVAFIQTSYAIQNILKSVNKTMILAQIQSKLKKRQVFQSQNSSKKLSMSDKSINGCKTKANLNHRPSIDRSIQNFHVLSQIRIAQSKQNYNNYKIANQFRNIHGQPATTIQFKKNHLNTSSTSIKISLADLNINNMPNCVPNQPQKVVSQIVQRPLIRINYESHPSAAQNFHENSRINCKITSFPKEQRIASTIKPQKSSLRPKCRQISEIIQRSEQGQNTQSQTSQMAEQLYNQLGTENLQQYQNLNLHISNPFDLVMSTEPKWT